VLLPASLIPLIPSFADEKTLIFDDSRGTIISSGKFTARANKFTDKFPDAKRMFPSGYDFIATVDAKDFTSALGRIEPVVDEESRAVKLTWANTLELRVGNKSTHGKDEVDYQTLKGDGKEGAFEMLFDWKFLNDFFERVEGPVSCMYTLGKNYAVFQSKEKKYLLARMGK
jgi:DNA polymerase III sliding clamp (beta) subunit (PCNA family)